MVRQGSKAADTAWEFVEREKRIDRFLRRISICAWSVALLIVVAFGVLTGIEMLEMIRGAAEGNLPWATVAASAIPFVVTIGGLSVLIATLSTVAVFLRLRTSSLAEIQLRLAALEDMLIAQPDERQQ